MLQISSLRYRLIHWSSQDSDVADADASGTKEPNGMRSFLCKSTYRIISDLGPPVDQSVEDSLDSSLLPALTEMTDPSSVHYIRSKYLLYRVVECTNRINHRNGI